MSLSTNERDVLGLRSALSSADRQALSGCDRPRHGAGLRPGALGTGGRSGLDDYSRAESCGGAGCGYADLAVVVHELGRALTPSPFLASAVLATGALLEAEHADVAAAPLAALVAGEAVGTVELLPLTEADESNRLTVGWALDGDTVCLDGISGFVLDADVADVLVVAA